MSTPHGLFCKATALMFTKFKTATNFFSNNLKFILTYRLSEGLQDLPSQDMEIVSRG